MVNDMEKRETLRQYLTYNKDSDLIDDIFLKLDNQMKYLHGKGYFVSELNSDTILLDESYDEPAFVFSAISKSSNKEQNFKKNIVDLSKLAIGAFISSENGFCDYTKMSDNYLKRYFNEISYYLPHPNYFESVLVEGRFSYYSDYVRSQGGNSKSNSMVKTKTNEYGKLYASNEEAAFIKIVFYPVVIICIITVIAVLSKILA